LHRVLGGLFGGVTCLVVDYVMEHYCQELKDEIKNRLIIYEDPKDLNMLINLAIKINNYFFKCCYQANTPQQNNQQHTKNKDNAIELDSTNQKNFQKNKFKQPDKKP